MYYFKKFSETMPNKNKFYHCTKTIFSFSKCFEKVVFPKKPHWNLIFIILSGKMIFLFPENLILFFRCQQKDNLSQKITWKYDIFFKCPEKTVFPKSLYLNMTFFVISWIWFFFFFVISEKMVFLFCRKNDISSLEGKWKRMMIFIKKHMEIYMYKC